MSLCIWLDDEMHKKELKDAIIPQEMHIFGSLKLMEQTKWPLENFN